MVDTGSKGTNGTLPGSQNELSDFYLERVSSTLFETGKKSSNTAILFASLVTALSIVVFVHDGKSEIEVFKIKLEQWQAAEILLILTSVTIYRLLCLLSLEEVLFINLKRLLEERNATVNPWAFCYPSIYSFHATITPKYGRLIVDGQEVAPLSKSMVQIPSFLGLFYIVGGFLYPVFLMFWIGWNDGFASRSWYITSLITVSFLAAGLVVAVNRPRDQPELSKRLFAPSNTGARSADP